MAARNGDSEAETTFSGGRAVEVEQVDGLQPTCREDACVRARFGRCAVAMRRVVADHAAPGLALD